MLYHFTSYPYPDKKTSIITSIPTSSHRRGAKVATTRVLQDVPGGEPELAHLAAGTRVRATCRAHEATFAVLEVKLTPQTDSISVE